jgi:hypothetical protein
LGAAAEAVAVAERAAWAAGTIDRSAGSENTVPATRYLGDKDNCCAANSPNDTRPYFFSYNTDRELIRS